MRARYDLQIKYQVEMDDNFLEYMYTGNIEINCYRRGIESENIGRACLPLKRLFDLNANTANPNIISDKVSIMSTLGDGKEKIGYLRYKLRMRNSIMTEAIQYRNKQGTSYTIKIINCNDLKESFETFVCYEFNNKSHRTRTCKGTDPIFNDEQIFYLQKNQDVIEYLNDTRLELVLVKDYSTEKLFDKNKLDEEFILGKAFVELRSLTKNKTIATKLSIISKSNDIIGTMNVSIDQS